MNLLLPFSLCVVSTLASGLVSHGAAVSSYIYLDEYSVLSDGTIRDDQGWLKTDGAFTNVFRDDSGLLNLLGVTADTIASFAGRPVLREDSWNAYATAGILPASWLRSAQSYSFLDSSVVIVSIKGTTYQGPPITIIDQPVSQTVLQGDNGDFFCFAQPWETLSYQWRFRSYDRGIENSECIQGECRNRPARSINWRKACSLRSCVFENGPSGRAKDTAKVANRKSWSRCCTPGDSERNLSLLVFLVQRWKYASARFY